MRFGLLLLVGLLAGPQARAWSDGDDAWAQAGRSAESLPKLVRVAADQESAVHEAVVSWQRTEEAAALCEGQASRVEFSSAVSCTLAQASDPCRIVAAQPRDERDDGRLAALGRQLLACALATRVERASPESRPSDAPPRMSVLWRVIEQPHHACARAMGGKAILSIRACTIDQSAGRCTILAPMPRDERDVPRLKTLGHELLHCFDGFWHDEWGRASRARP